jgi:hypothetical protein
MEERSSQDLIIAAAVCFMALIAFIAVMFLNRKSSGKASARTPNVKGTIPEGEFGTVQVQRDDGTVVRRSARQHKPVTPLVRQLC